MSFGDDDLKALFGAIAVLWFAIQIMAKRRPDIAWLQALRIPEISPERRARQQRRHAILSGFQLMLMGIVVPLAYGVITVMTFSDFDPWLTALVLVISAVCIGLGIFALVTNRRA